MLIHRQRSRFGVALIDGIGSVNRYCVMAHPGCNAKPPGINSRPATVKIIFDCYTVFQRLIFPRCLRGNTTSTQLFFTNIFPGNCRIRHFISRPSRAAETEEPGRLLWRITSSMFPKSDVQGTFYLTTSDLQNKLNLQL